MPKPDYSKASKADLAAALEKKLTKDQLRELVALHVEAELPESGEAGSRQATNWPSDFRQAERR